MTSSPSDGAWKWVGSNDQDTWFDLAATTRDEALAEAQAYGWRSIAEAQTRSLRLADWIDVADILDCADRRVDGSDVASAEYDTPPYFDPDQDIVDDLEARLRKAADEWQDAHGYAVTLNTFADMRNAERVTAPDDDGA